MPQLSEDAAATAHAAAAARLDAHHARVEAATRPVALTRGCTRAEQGEADGQSGGEGGKRGAGGGRVFFGDVLVVARGGGEACGGDDEPTPPLVLAVDPLSGVSAGVWAWPERAAGAGEGPAPPRALPAAAAGGGSGGDPSSQQGGTSCTALRVLPAAKGQAIGDPLRYGDRFALAIHDPAGVWRAAGSTHQAKAPFSAAAPAAAAPTPALKPAAVAPLLLLTSRCPVAALCPSARAAGGAGGGGGVGGAASGAQAVAFVEWRPPAPMAALPPGDAAWVALPADPEQRVLIEGEAVEAGCPLLFAHAPTRRPLWFGGGGGSGGGAVAARWAAAASRTRAGSPTKRAGGVDLGPAALPANLWRFELGA